ncbi:helix-turn-helix domain-containing protein [Miniimonas sp. S16]|uniref:helix-turn-helix domain-containing protein n=1 Tax=Miniimonas sp. S16 TaxID=2171623 RepID=UPI000D5291E4|nr:helix-turn-helix domain-containing protein [Miniimonas sp. S16]
MSDDKSERGDVVGPSSDEPSRRGFSVGPEALKAFAHPLRMALYSELQRRGSATASSLARALGESSGQTSYHLRQLERHGFVEDDPDAASGGRERWWRAVGFDMSSPELLRDPATEGAARALLHQVIAERAGALTAWANALKGDLDGTSGLLSSGTLVITPSEIEELGAELVEVVERYTDRARDRTPPADAVRVRTHVDVFPLEPPDAPDGEP